MFISRAKPVTVKLPVLQTPESFKGGSFKGGFFSSYAPFLVASIITILITSFDLATDWFAYNTIQQLHLHERFKTRDAMKLKSLYLALPQVFLAFCILATIIYAIHVIHFLYKFIIFRRKFFDVRDGISNDDPLIEKYSGELCTLLLVIFEDLPLSLLILAVQGVISCQCILVINNIVFYMCIVATCISIIWKLFQVLWSSGCCGKRIEYENGRSITIFRIISATILFGALGITILNSILIKPDALLHMIHRTDASKNNLFDKIYIERWLEQDSIVFMEKKEPMDSSYESSSVELEDSHFFNVALLSKIMTRYNHSLTIRKTCSHDNEMNTANYMPKDKDLVQNGANCVVIFNFLYDTSKDTIFYDYGYKVTGKGMNGHCHWNRFRKSYSMNMTVSDRAVTPQNDPASPAEIFNNPVTNDVNTLTIKIAHSILFKSGMEEQSTMYKACDNIKIAHRDMRSFNPCVNVVAEQ